MDANIKLGRIWGIRIGLHASWFLIFALVTFSLAAGYLPEQYPNIPLGAYWLLGGVTSLLFFGSVLAHELAHAFFALRNGIPVRGITLFIFGGVAQINREPKTPGAEFRIAIAGPVMSLILAALFAGLYEVDKQISAYLAAPSLWLSRINLALAVFNMIPGFPLDGGRVLRSVVWQLTGSLRRATRIAAGSGQLVAVGFMGLGAITTLAGGVINGLWLVFIGWFLQNAAASSLVQLDMREALRGATVRLVMSRDCVRVPGWTLVRDLIEGPVMLDNRRCFFVEDNGTPRGLLTVRDLSNVPHDEWGQTTAADAMIRWDRLAQVAPDTELFDALAQMDQAGIVQVPVFEGETVVGTVSRDEVLRYIRLRAQLGY